MQVANMMRLYAVVVILIWTGPYVSHVSCDLNYANSALTAVPATIANGNLDANQIKVDLSGNQLTTFASDLTCCTQISTLDLSRNSLTSVTISRASNLVITTLTLSNNNLQNSPIISAAVANNLIEIYLDDNSLTALDPTLLASLVKVNKISLVRNKFAVMPDFSASQHTLTDLDMEGNLLTDCTAIHTVGSLQRINLKLNSIATFPRTMNTVSRVTSFNLHENSIRVVPDVDFAAFTALHRMDLSRNGLTQFPNISVVGNTLEYIYLWGNSITSIDPSSFNDVQTLKFLSLAGNALTDFPYMGPNVGETLLELEIDHNQMTDVGDNLYNLKSLTRLNMHVNSLTTAPNISTSNLVSINLATNNLYSTDLSALAGKNISYLDLSSNKLTNLSGLTGLDTTLRELILKNNPITSIDYADLSGYVNLNSLDLSTTSLTTIPDLTNIQPLLTLKLDGVSLVCDCHLRWLTLWTSSASGRALTTSTSPCQQPANLVNVAWATIQLDACPETTTIESITSTAQVETTTEYITSTAIISTAQDDATTEYIASTAVGYETSTDISTVEETTAAQEQTTASAPNTTSDTMTSTVSPTTPPTVCDGNTESTLITNLLTNYDKSARPVLNESNAVVVKLGLALQQIMTLNEREQELRTKVWMRYTWTDESLTWNASQYCDISSVRIYPDRIWRPDITLYDDLNSDPNDNDAKIFAADVQSDGSVTWNVPKIISSNCIVDMRYYPWDEQKCTLKFGSWAYDGGALDLWNKSADGDITYYTSNGEWNVIGFSVKRNNILYNCCANPYPDVTFTLHIRRKAMYHLFNLILPAIFVTCTTFMVFYLPPESGEKVSLGVTALLALTVFLLLVAESVPKSETVPLIGQYFLATIIMMASSSSLTVITLNVHHRGIFGNKVPYWVRKLVLDWMARPLCLKARIDENLSPCESNKVWPKVQEDNKCEDGVILVQESKKTKDTEIIKHDRTDTEKSLHEILGVLRGFKEGKASADHKESCKTDWKLVALVIDRFLLYIFFVLTAAVTAIILSNHPYYTQPVLA